MAEFEVDDRVVHAADSHLIKCRLKDHGTVTRIFEDVGLTFAEVDWSSGTPDHTYRTPLSNLYHCTC